MKDPLFDFLKSPHPRYQALPHVGQGQIRLEYPFTFMIACFNQPLKNDTDNVHKLTAAQQAHYQHDSEPKNLSRNQQDKPTISFKDIFHS